MYIAPEQGQKLSWGKLCFISDINSTVAKRDSVLIGFMTPAGAIWSRYQSVVLMR